MNQIKENPFPYTMDNKRYHTLNYYFKNKYHQKIAKIPLHAGFTCPNRDGTKAYGGCTFCSEKGSGDSILAFGSELKLQYELGLNRMKHKWPDCIGFAYFQSYTNTYADFDTIKNLYDPFFSDDSIKGISIATRADCLSEETIQYIIEQSSKKETWIELGLQSIHEQTMEACNRKHDTQIVFDMVQRFKGTPVKTCLHIMNSLPGESKEDMIESARQVGLSGCDAIKIHMLHIIEGSAMAEDYKKNPFPLLSREDYVDVVVKQLEVLPAEMIIERLTGDGIAADLIAPMWTIKKTIVTNEIDKRMVELDTYQGKNYRD